MGVSLPHSHTSSTSTHLITMGPMVTLTTKSVRGLFGYEIVINRILQATKYIYIALLNVGVNTLPDKRNCQ